MLSHRVFLRAFAYEGGLVGTFSALEGNDSHEDLVAHRSESGEVFRAGLRHTLAQSSVSITFAFSMQTFRESGEVGIS